jgi:hypothetical protein
VLTDPDAFWIYQNGRISIPIELNHLGCELVDDSNTFLDRICLYSLIFMIVELMACVCFLVLVVPTLRRIEGLQFKVLNVYNKIPRFSVEFLKQ